MAARVATLRGASHKASAFFAGALAGAPLVLTQGWGWLQAHGTHQSQRMAGLAGAAEWGALTKSELLAPMVAGTLRLWLDALCAMTPHCQRRFRAQHDACCALHQKAFTAALNDGRAHEADSHSHSNKLCLAP